MRKYIFIIALALLAIPALTSCDTETNEEPGGTAIEKMCGYWDVIMPMALSTPTTSPTMELNTCGLTTSRRSGPTR